MGLIEIPPISLRVMSLNMQYAAGPHSDKNFLMHIPWVEQDYNLQSITDLIDEVNPDFVFLQEADKSSSRTDFIDQPKELIKRLGMKGQAYHSSFGSCMDLDEKKWSWAWNVLRFLYGQKSLRGMFEYLGIESYQLPEEAVHLHFGNAILSKRPIVTEEHHFFKQPYWDPLMNFNILRRKDERKSFLACEVEYPHEFEKIPISLKDVHLENADQEHRQRQAKYLSLRLKRKTDSYKIMAGDFNAGPQRKEDDDNSLEQLLKHPEMKYWQDIKDNTEKYATYPSEAPDKLIDTILVSKHLEIVHYFVHPKKVSDHLAVVADIKINITR